MESITPSVLIPEVKSKFKNIDDDEDPTGVGYIRTFRLAWDGNSGLELTDTTSRVSEHKFTLEAYYPPHIKRTLMHRVITNDSRDIVKALENTDNWIGFNAANPTTDIGQHNRYVAAVRKQEQDDLWTLTFDVTTTIEETY